MLLKEGFRLRYQHYLMLTQVVNIANMEQSDSKNFMDSLSREAADPDDILELDNDYSDIERLKGLM